MKLYLEATSEQGKPVNKSGNMLIKTEFTLDKKPFVIVIVDDKGFVYVKDSRHITIATFVLYKNGTKNGTLLKC